MKELWGRCKWNRYRPLQSAAVHEQTLLLPVLGGLCFLQGRGQLLGTRAVLGAGTSCHSQSMQELLFSEPLSAGTDLKMNQRCCWKLGWKLEDFFFPSLNCSVVGMTEMWWVNLHTGGGCHGLALALQEGLAGGWGCKGRAVTAKGQPGYKDLFSVMDGEEPVVWGRRLRNRLCFSQRSLTFPTFTGREVWNTSSTGFWRASGITWNKHEGDWPVLFNDKGEGTGDVWTSNWWGGKSCREWGRRVTESRCWTLGEQILAYLENW